MEVLYHSNSVKVIKVALAIRRRMDLEGQEWVQLSTEDLSGYRISRSDRSYAFNWLREAGLIETRRKPGLRMLVRLLPWKSDG
jgi:hypothetical protein